MGGKILTGGTRKDNFLYPTVLTDVPESARLIQEEAFAPVVVVNRFTELDEGLLKVNSTPYGLQAGVFTKDLKTAWECARRLECGGVLLNEVPSFRVDLMPYGGMKGSGMGREGPHYAVEELTEPKLIILDTGED
jgi:acyl-CoA reductase-like NAD-dependent aldehyde dehydrogenase